MATKKEASVEFTVSKEDFLRELSLVRDAAEKKGTLPILANVLIEATDDRVTLTASDLELSIRSSCPAKVRRTGSGTMPAHKLHSYVKLLPDGEVLVKFQDDHWAGMTGGRNRARIAGMSRESFPELPSMPQSRAEISAALFVSLIGRTSFAISAEESRFTLNGALLLIADSSITMVATDGHRLAFTRVNLGPDAFQEPLRLLIPKRAMSELAKLAADAGDAVVSIATDQNHLFLQVGERLLIARLLSGNFPDYLRVLPTADAHVAKLDREAFGMALQRVAEFADERSQAVRVQLTQGSLRIFASCLDSGESEESVSCEYAGPDLEIGFNAEYLHDFLKASDAKRVDLLVTDEKHAGELRPESLGEGDQYRYVVMPMRV